MRDRYLDGLRGWAAIAVLFSHIYLMLGNNPTPTILPFFMDGHLAVYVFFVLSGYVLTISSYRNGGIKSVISLAMRRYPRITIPVLISCSIAAAMMTFGLLHNQQAAAISGSEWLGSFYGFQASLPSLLRFSLYDVYFAYDPTNTFDAVLWTMHYEMIGSFMLFAALLLSEWSKKARLFVNLGLVAVTYYAGSPLLAFALGWLLASASAALHVTSGWKYSSIIGPAVVLVSLAVAAVRSAPATPTIMLSVLSTGLVLGILLSPRLQEMLASRFSRWLGRISFPLYLTHLLVICGPLSLAYITLSETGAPAFVIHSIIWVGGALVSLVAAAAFHPVEDFAISFSHAFSSKVTAMIPNRRPVLMPTRSSRRSGQRL